MSFFQRFYNHLIYAFDVVVRQRFMFDSLEQEAKIRFDFDFNSLREIAKETAICLVNIDSAIDHPEPLPPNVIPIGGLQILDAKALPENMEKFIAAGEKGTILMSLGTNVKSKNLGEKNIRAVLAFSAFPEYNFLWKFESDEKDLPVKLGKNVMVLKFLPQNDILAHPNIKAFITHSGMLSTHEAFWHGVPVIGIPFIADQKSNVQKAIDFGVGVKINFLTMNSKSLKDAITKVTCDSKYSENAKKLSKLFRDKPEKPLDKAIWWVEYVIRNSGNLDILRSPTVELGCFASNSYDVIFTMIVFIHLMIYAFVRLVKKLFRTKTRKSKIN